MKWKNIISYYYNLMNTHSVVCLRGDERGTCLPHVLGAPRGVSRVIFLIFGEKRIIHSYDIGLLQRKS